MGLKDWTGKTLVRTLVFGFVLALFFLFRSYNEITKDANNIFLDLIGIFIAMIIVSSIMVFVVFATVDGIKYLLNKGNEKMDKIFKKN